MVERARRGGVRRARWWLIDTYERTGQHEAARQLAREAIEADPEITTEREAADCAPVPMNDRDQMLANLRKAGLS